MCFGHLDIAFGQHPRGDGVLGSYFLNLLLLLVQLALHFGDVALDVPLLFSELLSPFPVKPTRLYSARRELLRLQRGVWRRQQRLGRDAREQPQQTLGHAIDTV